MLLIKNIQCFACMESYWSHNYFGKILCCRLMIIFLTQFWTVKLLIHKPQPHLKCSDCYQQNSSFAPWQALERARLSMVSANSPQARITVPDRLWNLVKGNGELKNTISFPNGLCPPFTTFKPNCLDLTM